MGCSSRHSGNVLFLILIAVALFAALSYAVTTSTRSSGGSPSKEKARAAAATLLQQGTALRSAVMRVKLSNNCTDYTLDFTSNAYVLNNGTAIQPANSAAPGDKSCHLFDSNGGNMVPVFPPQDALATDDTSFAVATQRKLGSIAVYAGQIYGVGTDGVGGTESANDIYYQILGLNKETCIAVNELVGATNPSGLPGTAATSGGASLYSGSLTTTLILNFSPNSGFPAVCIMNTATNPYRYVFFFTLVER